MPANDSYFWPTLWSIVGMFFVLAWMSIPEKYKNPISPADIELAVSAAVGLFGIVKGHQVVAAKAQALAVEKALEEAKEE